VAESLETVAVRFFEVVVLRLDPAPGLPAVVVRASTMLSMSGVTVPGKKFDALFTMIWYTVSVAMMAIARACHWYSGVFATKV
jgi:hypothetical protein